MIAVAISADEHEALSAALARAGASIDRVLDFGDRQVVLAVVDSAAANGPAAHTLRGDGWLAVARPDDGSALAAWWRDTAPVVVRDRLGVTVAWSEHDRPSVPHRLELAPGGFGNGHHPTTRLLLEYVVDVVAGGERVLDVGCGSGVLGLAALELGAVELVALDRKQTAVDATMASARLNAMGARTNASTASPATVGGPFDLVVANIARDGVAALADELVVATGHGRLAVSGVTPAQTQLVAELLGPLELLESRVEGDWAALVFGGRE